MTWDTAKTGLLSGEFLEDVTCSSGFSCMRRVPQEACSAEGRYGLRVGLLGVCSSDSLWNGLSLPLSDCGSAPWFPSPYFILSSSSCVPYGLNEYRELMLIKYEYRMNDYSEHILKNVPLFPNLSLSQRRILLHVAIFSIFPKKSIYITWKL